MKKLIAFFAVMLIATSVYALDYIKIDDHNFRTEEAKVQKLRYNYNELLLRKASLEKQLTNVVTLITEADKLGVVKTTE